MQLAQAFGGMAYGARNGMPVHISEVESGLACDCRCWGCGHPLVARKGERIRHHFAHAADSRCAGGAETALHRMGKRVLQEGLPLLLPSVRAEPPVRLCYDRAELEVPLRGDTGVLIQPDVILRRGAATLLVELTVTHASEPAKLAELRRRRLDCIDISLSGIDRWSSPDAVRTAVSTSAPRFWLFSRKLDADAMRDQDRRRLKILRETRERLESRRTAEEMSRSPAAAAEWDSPGWAMDFGSDRAGLAVYRRWTAGQSRAPEEAGPFRVHPDIWRASVMGYLAARPFEHAGLGALMAHLRQSGMVKPGFSGSGAARSPAGETAAGYLAAWMDGAVREGLLGRSAGGYGLAEAGRRRMAAG